MNTDKIISKVHPFKVKILSEKLDNTDRDKVGHFIFALFRLAFFVGMAYVLLFPLMVMLSRALRPIGDMYNPSIVWIPSGLTYENFQLALKALNYSTSLPFSLRIVVISTLLAVISCSMAGYALGRYKLKAGKWLTGIAVLTFIVPMQTYIIPLYFELQYFDFFKIGKLIGLFAGAPMTVSLTNSEVAYYILNALGMGLRSGVFILLFSQVFRALPQELEDAARIDGASEFKIFYKIMVPNAKPALLVTIIMSIVWNWNDYFFPAILFQQNQFLSTKLSIMRQLATAMIPGITSYGDNLGETVIMFAGAFLYIIPMLIMYMFVQRFFMQSVERSGITG